MAPGGRSASPRLRAWAASAALGALAACNYDFDAFSALGPPLLDGGSSGQGGAAGAGQSGAAGAGASKSDAGASGPRDGGKGGGGAAGTGSGGSGASSGSAGAGGVGTAGGNGGTGGASGASGSAGAGTGGGSGTGGEAGTGGAGSTDASVDGSGAGGAGGSGAAGVGGSAGTGMGGSTGGQAGGGGSGTTGGAAGGNTPPDGGIARDVRADTALDGATPPFDCAAIGGRVYEDHCYYAKSAAVTWEAARQACAAPAHLVTITSVGEHDFVTSFLVNESRWIGYYRPTGSAKNLAAFEWVTGEPTTFRHWYAANGEPDYDGQCVRLGPSNNWGDNPCSAAFPAICERE